MPTSDLIAYLVKTSACMSAFYLLYKALLSRETFHRFNRVILLAGISMSFILPFCVITVHKQIIVPQVSLVDIGNLSVAPVHETELPIAQIVTYIFWIGAVGYLLAIALSIRRILQIIRRGTIEQLPDGYTLSITKQLISPFSWYKYIVMSASDYAENGTEILAHEKAHLRMRHSLDLMLTDLLVCIQWFSPAIWLLRNELRYIHEYEADEAVLKTGIDAKTYQLLLIKKAAGGGRNSIANSLNHSKLKNRITMMLQKRSSAWAKAKVLYVLPLVGLALSAFSQTVYSYLPADNESSKKPEAVQTTVGATQKPKKNASQNKETETKSSEKFSDAADQEIVGKTDTILVRTKTSEKNGAVFPIDGITVVGYAAQPEASGIDTHPLYIIDGKEVSSDDFQKIKPEQIENVAVWKNEQALEKFGEKGRNGVVAIQTKKLEQVILEPETFQEIDQMPEFPGGVNEARKFMAQKIKYPVAARQKGEQGDVVVQFIIGEDGSISNITVKQSVSFAIDREAIRVVESMPKWMPGKLKGKAVAIKCTMPITFKLQ